jgi:hexosaminidase
MKSLVSLTLLASFASALWPQPINYEHGDTVLFIQENVEFFWYEFVARNVGSVADQHPDQIPFAFTSQSNNGPETQDSPKLRKRYVGPSNVTEGYGGNEGVSGSDIIDYAVKSTWKTIFKHNFYPWKFHPRNWKEPSPKENTVLISEITIKLLASDPPNVSKPLAGEVDESYTLTVSEDGETTIAANSSVGIARALTSFTQLFYSHSDGEQYIPRSLQLRFTMHPSSNTAASTSTSLATGLMFLTLSAKSTRSPTTK